MPQIVEYLAIANPTL